ncbi:MAG: alpha-amylase family glycosyl hydrolase [Kangiellaceae bacterium]|nr:alpha-amylase family glycosyl hydrolase [Kangiellaceae bacterium]MCW9000841.1 alpha-amylase family glycosyl hydrolase [Kangiellaceae bacterium]
MPVKNVSLIAISALLTSCVGTGSQLNTWSNTGSESGSIYGTLEPMASHAVYFLMTDRFVNGDKSNDFPEQGGKYPTYRNEIKGPNGKSAFVGYMGGDFKGILNNADYISDMGFGAIWLTPIVDQPDEAFSGGEPIEFGGAFKDGGKTGYHGYWGSNFFELDEHLPSSDLSFKQLTQQLRDKHQLKTVLDVVANHGSPAFTMQEQRDKFGKIFSKEGTLLANHQNLEPEQLEPSNPLHEFYNRKKDIMQLSDMNQDNPAVLKYFVDAYSQWIEQGANAFRIDTIKHMPHSFWKRFADEIRKKHPEFFMFAESYSFDADFIAQHTLDKNGGITVLDFPGRESMLNVFENKSASYKELDEYLYLEKGPYKNIYELMTFYDNHDMSRINADTNGFIDVHNWLFTSRGIPVVYYGSEIGFMAGTKEHEGNRNYFGQENISKAKKHKIHTNLKRIANIRRDSVALQRGLQVNLTFSKDTAAFYRVYEHNGEYQTALVQLNKSDRPQKFQIDRWLSNGDWKEQVSGESFTVVNNRLSSIVPAHGVKVFILSQKNNSQPLISILESRMSELNHSN